MLKTALVTSPFPSILNFAARVKPVSCKLHEPRANELRIGMDIGGSMHAVAVGLADGTVLEQFEIAHGASGFGEFFSRIETHAASLGLEVAVAMEGYNGHARPLDELILARGWRLYNVNNLKLARFKEIFPGAAKSDRMDCLKALELFQLRDHLPLARGVLQEIPPRPWENELLKRLSRRRRHLVDERVRLLCVMESDLQAVAPGLLEITGSAGNLWFLRFLTCREDLEKLARIRQGGLLAVPGIGVTYAKAIAAWQARALFGAEVKLVGAMIQEDAARLLELHGRIKKLEAEIEAVASAMAATLRSIPGFGLVSAAELAGEIGTISRFKGEASLALYLGMANLENSSGRKKGSKPPRHVNRRAKAALMTAVDRHRKSVPQSQRYYEKKRAEGKAHNQAIRALGRHLCRVIFKMIITNQPYRIEK
jgi:transposase